MQKVGVHIMHTDFFSTHQYKEFMNFSLLSSVDICIFSHLILILPLISM